MPSHGAASRRSEPLLETAQNICCGRHLIVVNSLEIVHFGNRRNSVCTVYCCVERGGLNDGKMTLYSSEGVFIRDALFLLLFVFAAFDRGEVDIEQE